jgi:hypothetical protein
MVLFSGRLQGPDLDPSRVSIDIDDGRFRVAAGRRQLGSWPLEAIKTERRSIYRFGLDIDGDQFDFIPDDPSKFSDIIGAVIDLTSSSRFGLKERLERASGN